MEQQPHTTKHVKDAQSMVVKTIILLALAISRIQPDFDDANNESIIDFGAQHIYSKQPLVRL